MLRRGGHQDWSINKTCLNLSHLVESFLKSSRLVRNCLSLSNLTRQLQFFVFSWSGKQVPWIPWVEIPNSQLDFLVPNSWLLTQKLPPHLPVIFKNVRIRSFQIKKTISEGQLHLWVEFVSFQKFHCLLGSYSTDKISSRKDEK